MRVEQIGDATLYLADSREIEPTLQYNALVSDPPFGMAFRSNYRAIKHRAIANDKDDALLSWACGLAPSHSAYIFARWDNIRDLPKPQSLITWVKNNWSMGDLEHEHARQTEVCLFFRGAEHFFPSGRPQDVINCPRSGNEHHPTEKPVQLMMAVVGWTAGVVLDPFMGSGSTGVACARMGRPFIGVELDEAYFDTSCRRIEQSLKRPEFFIERPAAPVQEGLF